MAKLPDMGKMIGPLPLGAWIIVIGGGLAVAVYTKRQNEPALLGPDELPEDTGTTPGVGTGGSGQWVDLNPPPSQSTDTPPATNEEYAVRAITMMVGRGYPPTTVTSGVYKWLNETGTLSASEFAIVSEIIRLMGSPPIPVPGPTQTPPTTNTPKPPPPKPKPVPTGYTIHTIQKGQNMSVIASFYRAYPSDIWRTNFTGVKRLDGSRGFLTWYYDIERNVGKRLVIPNAIKNYRRG